MKNDMKFYKCNTCGNFIEMINSSGSEIICCGHPMTSLVANTVDAAQEKHIPVAKLECNKLVVTVGSVAHPMSLEHHIAWIAILQDDKYQRVSLDHNGTATATFHVTSGSIKIYEYCNLHGLWTTEIGDYVFDEKVCSPEFPDGCI